MVATDLPAMPEAAGAARHIRNLTAASLALLALSLIALMIDTRTLGGVNVWIKPVKFALSFVVLFATLEFVVNRLSYPVRAGRTLTICVFVLTTAFILEMGYIMLQAGKAEASHFNNSTVFNAVMYGLMGLGAVSLVLVVAAVGWLALRDRDARFGPCLRAGIGAGFLSTTVLTLIVAGYMSNTTGHFVGVPGADAAVLPFLGWSATVGDLRPAHFVALHAMQVLPLLGWFLDRYEIRRVGVWIGGASVLWAALTMALFVQALAGRPLIAL